MKQNTNFFKPSYTDATSNSSASTLKMISNMEGTTEKVLAVIIAAGTIATAILNVLKRG